MTGRVTGSREARPRAGRQRASLIAGALGATVVAGLVQADVIADFNAVAIRTAAPPVAYPAVTPEEQRTVSWVDLATVHAAMYDAVVAIEGGYEPYAVVPDNPAQGASAPAAAGAAACAVLQGLFPNRAPQYATDCLPYQPGASTDPATAQGITLGVEVGQKMLLERADDGRIGPPDYVPKSGIGVFVPAAPGNPVQHFAPYMRTFTLLSSAQMRAEPPPALDSAAYATAFNEVKTRGQAGGAMLTLPEQENARFHTENPNHFWARSTRVFLNQPTLLDNARLGALLQLSMADAILGCFESKYHYEFWRPRTAIAAAEGDGNPATSAEASWAPFVPTPNHPEYPSGHTCVAGAVGEVVKEWYGPQADFAWNSTATGATHTYGSVQQMVKEIKDARVHGGMHFRFANDAGATLGRRTAHWVTRTTLRPLAKQ